MKLTAIFTIAKILLCGALLFCAHHAHAQDSDAPDAIKGTVVSLRGNILVIRPELRPVAQRVAFDDSTLILLSERSTRAALEVGKRVSVNGNYTAQNGLQPRWIEVAEGQIPQIYQESKGFQIAPDGNSASLRGVIKSMQPFVVTDDAKTDFTFDLTNLRSVWRARRGDRNTLLIGTRLYLTGKTAPDGVTAAKMIFPERGQSPFGTMFGTITKVASGKIEIRPRFTQDTLAVALAKNLRLQREKRFDENVVGVGNSVTFWGEMRPMRGDPKLFDTRLMSDFKALVLLMGAGRYPAAQNEGAPQFVSGKIVSLDPVRLQKTDKTLLTILPTAQMPIVELSPATTRDLKVGDDAMFVLSRQSDDSFVASEIVLNASPWVGYGG